MPWGEILGTVERIGSNEVKIEALNQAFSIQQSSIALYYTFWLTTFGAAFVTSLGTFLTFVLQTANPVMTFTVAFLMVGFLILLVALMFGYMNAEENLKDNYNHEVSRLIVQQQELT